MTRQMVDVTDALFRYLSDVSLREPEILSQLREDTGRMPEASMQISPIQGQFIQLLLRLMGARRTLELGVFTGYSALSAAMALPDDGSVVACEIDERWAAIARRYWEKAGLEHKIDLHLGPATETLQRLAASGHRDSFDFAFIDADKENYLSYYELCLTLIRKGGLIAVDNVLWGGSVANPRDQHPDTLAIRAVNSHIHQDARVDVSLIPIGDGLTLARKR